MQHPKRQNLPLAMTINYCAPVAKGAFDVNVAEKRTNRSTQHFSVEMTQGADVIATSTLVFAARPDEPADRQRVQGVDRALATELLGLRDVGAGEEAQTFIALAPHRAKQARRKTDGEFLDEHVDGT